jgi:hypothetical protein
MPSIEVACIGAVRAPPPPEGLSFAVEYEVGLKSHRGPTPKFQRDFDDTSGALYHIGNSLPADPRSGAFTAYFLLSADCRDADPPLVLEFAPEHQASAHNLLSWLLRLSPIGQLLFTSDWQFGPDSIERHSPLTLASFWKLHDARQLHLNALYSVVATV